MPDPRGQEDDVEVFDDKEIRLGVVGVTGSGKSAFIKLLTKCENISVSGKLESETSEVKQYPFEHNKVKYVLVDTPGFDDTTGILNHTAVFKLLAKWLVETYDSGKLLNGLIYLLPITKTRQRGSEVQNQRMIKKVCGEKNYKNIMLGLTFCDEATKAKIKLRREELMDNKNWWGGTGAVIQEIPFGRREECLDILESFAPKRKMVLQLQSEVNQGISIDDTAAALEVVRGLKAIRDDAAEKLAEMKRLDGLRRRKAAADKKAQMTMLEYGSKQKIEEREAAALQYVQKREQDIRRELERLEEKRSQDEEERGRKLQELRGTTRQLELTVERLRNEEEIARQQALRYRKFHEDLTSSGNTLNKWGANDTVSHGNVAGHDMLGNFCDHCLTPTFPKQGNIFICEKCYDGNNPLRGLENGEKSLMLCASCKAAGFSCLDSKHEMKLEPIPVLESLSGCSRDGAETEIWCRKCRKSVRESLYLHCCECAKDQFDLCITCWGKGASCGSKKHTLHVLSFCPQHIRE